jgi:aryl-phospho-beta-D-glucosidase BglC (GH1 family)
VLRVQGDAVVDADGARVLLRGAGLGGWMNMENFITGYPASESAMRTAVAGVLGVERGERFFERLVDAFFGEADARLLAELGVNCLRLPINYRAFEREDGFARLERAVELCAAQRIYTVIDMHAVPGSQNQHWHSDNATHVAAFWQHPHFQDLVVDLWRELAERFRGHESVAGYNLLNEPGDPTGEVIGPFHDRLVAAVREVDPDHIVFVDGNTYSTDFSIFGEPYENAVYALHDYARAGMSFGGPYPGYTGDVWVDRDTLEETFLERTRFQRETGTPIWVGEFGPVYTGDGERDEQRYQVLSDQLDIYDRHGAGWSIWTYKDVGLHGLVETSPESAYMERFGDLIAKKRRLGVDAWGSTHAEVPEVIEPLHDLIAREFPSWSPYPWGVREATDLLVRHILFAQALLPEYAERFRGLDDVELDALADSFALERCRRRERLCEIVSSRMLTARPAGGRAG